ncbi:Uncharacterized protein HZ326_1034 [Fusarium oxysporum f. sp. albedinis]|nr:Uncharacterized protein HZ326_1034 [Fusarium oxysporum f. sp. albedinis]
MGRALHGPERRAQLYFICCRWQLGTCFCTGETRSPGDSSTQVVPFEPCRTGIQHERSGRDRDQPIFLQPSLHPDSAVSVSEIPRNPDPELKLDFEADELVLSCIKRSSPPPSYLPRTKENKTVRAEFTVHTTLSVGLSVTRLSTQPHAKRACSRAKSRVSKVEDR